MPYLTEQFGNPSSVHGFGQRARGAIDEARAQVAALIGARDSEIVFTGSGTEADNLAIGGVLRGVASDPDAERTDLVTSSIEHHAVLNSAKGLDRARHRVTFARVDETGRLDLTDLAAAVTEKTALVSVMFANNETGVLQPIDDVIRNRAGEGRLRPHGRGAGGRQGPDRHAASGRGSADSLRPQDPRPEGCGRALRPKRNEDGGDHPRRIAGEKSPRRDRECRGHRGLGKSGGDRSEPPRRGCSPNRPAARSARNQARHRRTRSGGA